jgi:hypothetical protein
MKPVLALAILLFAPGCCMLPMLLMHGQGEHDHAAADKTPAIPTMPSASYPTETCIVSGRKLGAMDERVAYRYADTEVQFCCAQCLVEFERDPATYLARLPSAAK